MELSVINQTDVKEFEQYEEDFHEIAKRTWKVLERNDDVSFAVIFIDDEEITIYMVNPKAPCFIKDEKESYIYLILPVNFNHA